MISVRRVRRVRRAVIVLLGAYLMIRALAEPFTIDVDDPSSYHRDWGGPSLIGVLAVHCTPGIISAATAIVIWNRRHNQSRPLR